MEEKNKVAREVAIEEFSRIFRAARTTWEKYKRRNPEEAEFDKEDILEAIENGTITVDDNGFPTLHFDAEFDSVKELKFKRRIIGKDISAASRSKDESRALYFATGQYFGVSPAEIESLETGDISLLNAIWSIFLRM